MAVEYAPLKSTSVSEYVRQPRKKGSGWTSFFRIFIVIVEIGATMIPGVGPELALGIGLAAAAANTALSAEEGTLTGIGVGIDFLSAVLPFAGAAKMAARSKAAIDGIRKENQFMKGALGLFKSDGKVFAEDGEVAINSVEKNYKNQMNKMGDRIKYREKNLNKARENAYNSIKQQRTLEDNGFRRVRLTERTKGTIRRLSQGRLNQEEQALSELQSKIFNFDKITEEQIESNIAKIAAKYNTTIEKIEKQMKELERVHKEIKTFTFAQRSSRKMFFRQLEKISSEDVANIAKSVYGDIFDTTKTIARRNIAKNAVNVRNANFNKKMATLHLSESAKETIRNTKNTLRMGRSRLTVDAYKQTIETFFQHIPAEDIAKIKNKMTLEQFQKDLIYTASGQKDVGVFARAVKFTGSGRFNDKWVQRMQLIDPNDLGRAPIEWAYRHLKGKIENRLEQKVIAKAEKQGATLVRKFSDLEKAAVASGAITINSKYLFSIKRIKRGARGAALLVFNSKTTGSKTGKNVGGKRPIVAYCTGDEFIRLAEEGSSYYWAVGARKGWFISRGGHAKSGHGAFQNMSTRLSLFLAFVPIQSLRNVLSIVSNWVGNVNSMIKGDYWGKYWPKLERALVRSTINRSARLVTKVAIGGTYSYRKGLQAIEGVQRAEGESSAIYQAAVSKARAMSMTKSMWLGRELQRYSMATLGIFEGANKQGMFAFKSGASSGRSAGENLTKKILMQSAPTAVRGQMMRSTSYYRGRTVEKGIISIKGVAGRDRAKDLITSKRNFQQVGRVYSAFTVPGVPTLRSLTKFK